MQKYSLGVLLLMIYQMNVEYDYDKNVLEQKIDIFKI
jgi:hypothetical protein